MPFLPRSNWPKVIQIRKGEAGNQIQVCKSKDLGWGAHLSPGLRHGLLEAYRPNHKAWPQHGAVCVEHAREGICGGLRLILSYCVLFLLCHKKGTIITALSGTYGIQHCSEHMTYIRTFNPHSSKAGTSILKILERRETKLRKVM